MALYAKREIDDFHVAIVAIELRPWQEVNVTFKVSHISTHRVGEFSKAISKDDYVLRRQEISGSRTDFVEKDPKNIAEAIIENLRLKKRRGDDLGNVAICIEQLEICEWNNSSASFEARS